jgi:hypothetical protein
MREGNFLQSKTGVILSTAEMKQANKDTQQLAAAGH